MITVNFLFILIVELLIFSVGSIALTKELSNLKSTIKKKETLSLIGILFFTNLVYFTRALGIITGNATLRQLGPTLSAFAAALFLIYWGSAATRITELKRNFMFLGISFGIVSFVIGFTIDIVYLSILGIILLGIIPVSLIIWLFYYVSKTTSYPFARKRIFLMSLAFTMTIIFEGTGVYLMRTGIFRLAWIAFLGELPARIVMYYSIKLPRWLQEYLNKFRFFSLV